MTNTKKSQSAEAKNSAAKQTVVFFDEKGVAAHSFQMPEKEAFELAKYAEENYNTDVHYKGHSKVNQLKLDCMGTSSTEAENVAKLRNVSYDEVYELIDNMEDNPMIDLGNGVYVKTTDGGGIWDLGIETTDGNYRHTIGDFGDDVVCLLTGEENYIDHLTYTLNEYINSVNEEKEA